jgi:hypothetical protein
MDSTDITFGRAFTIWWSYVWRAFLLMLPVMIVAMVIAIAVLPLPKVGQPAALRPDQVPGMMGKMFCVWLFTMVFYVAAQVQAVRWMLKTKWTGFRLKVVPDP